MQKLSSDEFIKRAVMVHDNKYDYTNTSYEHSLKKVEIYCPKHGPFLIKPSNHINNKQGCYKCGKEAAAIAQKRSLDSILQQLQAKNNANNYDFSLIQEFVNIRSNVPIICKKHGEYTRPIRDVLRSNYFGCIRCKLDDDKFTNQEFIDKSIYIHNNFYLYSKTQYTKSHEPVIVTCPVHGDFEVMAYIHMAGGGFCPSCTEYVSSYEIELTAFLREYLEYNDISTSYRKFKDIKEIDIIINSKKVGIEINGLYWHSDIFKTKNYHLNKSQQLEKLGFRLIHIFEDEYLTKQDICKSMLLNSIGKSLKKIYARKCIVKTITHKEAEQFLLDNHIQGTCVSKFRYGLFYDNEIVAVMTFGKKRVCLGSKSANDSEYELLRFCSAKYTNVIGGASKLFKYFIHHHNPKKIISYCDKRWGTGTVYGKLNFKKIKDTNPNYFYTKNGKRFNRFAFRKDILIKKGFDKNKTEAQIMKELGYHKIYDCGSIKFEWTPRELER